MASRSAGFSGCARSMPESSAKKSGLFGVDWVGVTVMLMTASCGYSGRVRHFPSGNAMPQTYKLALLDDYQKVAMRMADWDRLKKRGVEITVFHEAFKSVEDAAQKLAPFDMLGLLRERTAFPKALIDKLPNLKFMVLTGARAASLDDKAGRRLERTDGGARLGAADDVRPRSRQGRAAGPPGQVARRHRADGRARGQAARHSRPRQARQPCGPLWQGLWHGGRGLEPEPHAREGGGRRRQVRQQGRAAGDIGLRVDPSRSLGSHARPAGRSRPRQDEEDRDPGEHVAWADRRRGGPDRGAQEPYDPACRPRRLRQ